MEKKQVAVEQLRVAGGKTFQPVGLQIQKKEDNKKKAAAKKAGGKPAAKGAKGAKTEKKGFFGFGK